MKKSFLLIIFILTTAFGFSQTKFEREYRISESEVPQKALTFIKKAFVNQKVKWYKEISQTGVSIEAKTKFRKHYFSVEFDTTGNIQDVEKKIKLKELSDQKQQLIEESLKKEFKKYRINKIQIQWIADNKTLIELINSTNVESSFKIAYEIVLESKANGKPELYEVLISEAGEIKRKLKIRQRSYDNIEF